MVAFTVKKKILRVQFRVQNQGEYAFFLIYQSKRQHFYPLPAAKWIFSEKKWKYNVVKSTSRMYLSQKHTSTEILRILSQDFIQIF